MNPIKLVVRTAVQMVIARGYTVSPLDHAFTGGLISFDDYMTGLKVLSAVTSGGPEHQLEAIYEACEVALNSDFSQELFDELSDTINREGEGYLYDPYESADKNLAEIRSKMLRRFTRPRTQAEQDHAEELALTVHENYVADIIDRDHTMELAILGPLVGHAKILSDNLSQVTQTPTVDEVIMILDAPLDHTPRMSIQSWSINVETMMSEDVFTNPTEHYLYAPHERMTEEDAAEVLSQFGITKSKMPRILMRDPVVRFYGWAKGDLIKIHRPAINAMAGEYQYRVVV